MGWLANRQAQIGDEFTFITELSYHLSTRYQRPVSSIVVTVHHGACMLFGGSFDAAYVLSIFALPSQLLPTTNKRNAALIQKHMKESLGVGADRGYVRFVPTREEDVAHRGKTMAGEIDELERALGAKKAAVETDGESTAVESIPKKTRSPRKLSVKVGAQRAWRGFSRAKTNTLAVLFEFPSSHWGRGYNHGADASCERRRDASCHPGIAGTVAKDAAGRVGG